MHLLLLNYEADNFGRKKSRRKIKSLTDLLSQSYDNSLREEENLNLEGLWVYKFMFFPQLTQWAKVRLILPLNRQIARVGRRSLSPHSANCKLQVNRLWQDFPSAQDKFHSASFHCTGTGRKQSKYRHQRAVFTPTGAPRKLRRGAYGTWNQHPPTLDVSRWDLPEVHGVKIHQLENTHGTRRELCPASLPAALQGFWSVWATVCLILAQPSSVLLIWHQGRYLVGGRMCPGPAHGLGALMFPYLVTCVIWLCCFKMKSISKESMFSCFLLCLSNRIFLKTN